MTNTCQLKRGFFVMRACPAPVIAQCSQCQKAICQQHLADVGDSPTCVECAKNFRDEYYDDYWIYSYRYNYYDDGYEPFKYTDEDYSSFEDHAGSGLDWDDDYAGDFHDS